MVFKEKTQSRTDRRRFGTSFENAWKVGVIFDKMVDSRNSKIRIC